MKKEACFFVVVLGMIIWFSSMATGQTLSEAYKGNIYQPGFLKPVDSIPKVNVGDGAPLFTLPAVS